VAAELGSLLTPGSTVYILGGEGALSKQVFDDVHAMGLNPVRLSGPDRYATATAIATEVAKQFGGKPHTVMVATGTDYPDALAPGRPPRPTRWAVSSS